MLILLFPGMKQHCLSFGRGDRNQLIAIMSLIIIRLTDQSRQALELPRPHGYGYFQGVPSAPATAAEFRFCQTTFVAQNGILQKIEWLLLGQEYNIDTGGWSYTNDTPFLYLSNSPLWPWCFGNCKVEISSSELRAVRKAGQHSKIDPIHALIDALWLFDLSEGQVQQ